MQKQKIKKIITSGCSFTEGNHTWPNYLAKYFGWDLINLGVSGAGNEYISKSIIDYLEANTIVKDETVIIVMWSGIGRKDILISGEEWYFLKDYPNKSNLLGVEDSYWIHSGGMSGWTRNQEAEKIFRYYYQMSDPLTLCKDTLFNFIMLQNYLENKKFKYKFLSYVNYWKTDIESIQNGEYCLGHFAKNVPMFYNLDFDNWVFLDKEKNGIFEWCLLQNCIAEDKFHPSQIGHERFTKEVLIPNLTEFYS